MKVGTRREQAGPPSWAVVHQQFGGESRDVAGSEAAAQRLALIPVRCYVDQRKLVGLALTE